MKLIDENNKQLKSENDKKINFLEEEIKKVVNLVFKNTYKVGHIIWIFFGCNLLELPYKNS